MTSNNAKANTTKRSVDVLVLSDIHLGTYGCHAKELLAYLRSVSPKRVVLNGDIIDIWQFSKRYWPKSHMQVTSHIMGWVAEGVQVDYITGNHDELLRKFEGFKLGKFHICNKLVLNLDGKKVWIFHGDVFDVTMQHSKWLAKLGAIGYDTLILVNRFVNFILQRLQKDRISFSKRIKNSVKSAVKFIQDFEQIASDIAISNGYDFVCCGHIHQPVIKNYINANGRVTYLNSGDWIENLTALEYSNGSWEMYEYQKDNLSNQHETDLTEKLNASQRVLFDEMLAEFTSTKSHKNVEAEDITTNIPAKMFIQH